MNATCLVAAKRTQSHHEEQRWQFSLMDIVGARGPWKYFLEEHSNGTGHGRKESTNHKSSHRRTKLDKAFRKASCSDHKERRNAASKLSISKC